MSDEDKPDNIKKSETKKIEKFTKHVGLKLPKSVYDKVKEEAEAEGLGVSTKIRTIVMEWLAWNMAENEEDEEEDEKEYDLGYIG